MGGRACIRGMRITVSLVLSLIANGLTTGQSRHDSKLVSFAVVMTMPLSL
jgi:uncharacterized protein (DUF433 family)